MFAAAAQAYGPISLSPDGQRLAVTVVGKTSDVWVYELKRGTFTRLTVEGSNSRPIWTSDGRRIVYQRSSGANQDQMVWQLADGSGAEEVLTTCDYGCSACVLVSQWEAPRLLGGVTPTPVTTC